MMTEPNRPEIYQSVGVTRFLFMGHPDFGQMTFFGEEVLPGVRQREQAGVN